jgi:hypothetical protein
MYSEIDFVEEKYHTYEYSLRNDNLFWSILQSKVVPQMDGVVKSLYKILLGKFTTVVIDLSKENLSQPYVMYRKHTVDECLDSAQWLREEVDNGNLGIVRGADAKEVFDFLDKHKK